MAPLSAGAKAPAFELQSTNGEKSALADALQKGPVVAAFFKVSCPTCQFTAPFLERLHETYGGAKFTLWGISQDDARDTRDFCQEFEVEFPALIDEKGYPVSNQYGITNCPHRFSDHAGRKNPGKLCRLLEEGPREDCRRGRQRHEHAAHGILQTRRGDSRFQAWLRLQKLGSVRALHFNRSSPWRRLQTV